MMSPAADAPDASGPRFHPFEAAVARRRPRLRATMTSSSHPMANPESEAVKVLAVIPARYTSSRFPGKPIASIAGKPMIQHVVERVQRARHVSRTLVATDEPRIRDAVEGFGGEAVLTRRDHPTGTDRVAEVAAHIPAEIYVNVQGDEPLIDPETIDGLVAVLVEDHGVLVASSTRAIVQANDIMDPNVTKVVRDFDGNALYFSRAPVPWVRDREESVAAQHWKHIGLYAFRREALLDFPTLPPGELERLEQLEQLRWLENGYRIRMVETEYDAISVDVPADIDRVEKLLPRRQVS
jgi:3-deoxy-manno-octulosonate cytidylyltransferase (CMP-KDO synthetase)